MLVPHGLSLTSFSLALLALLCVLQRLTTAAPMQLVEDDSQYEILSEDQLRNVLEKRSGRFRYGKRNSDFNGDSKYSKYEDMDLILQSIINQLDYELENAQESYIQTYDIVPNTEQLLFDVPIEATKRGVFRWGKRR